MVSTQTRIATVILYALAPVGMSLVPFVVGAASDRLRLSPEQSGVLASADLAGLFVASLSAVYWIRRFSWRKTCMLSLFILIVGNLLSIWAPTYLMLCGVRFITELGSGILLATIIACIGDFDKPDRYYAFGTAATVSLSILFSLGLPPLIELQGASVIYIGHALLALLAFGIIPCLPEQGQPRYAPVSGQTTQLIPAFLAMFALFCIALAEGGLWAYLERIGKHGGFDLILIGKALALANLMGAIGALGTSLLSTRFGRVGPVSFGLIAFICGAFLMAQQGTSFYVLGMALTQFCWGFTLPYIMLISVESDTSGRYFILLSAFKMGGFALGPAVVSLFLQPGSYQAVIWVCSAFLLASLVLVTPLSVRLDRRVSRSTVSTDTLASSN